MTIFRISKENNINLRKEEMWEEDKKYVLRPYIYPAWVNHTGSRKHHMSDQRKGQCRAGFNMPSINSKMSRELNINEMLSFNRPSRGQKPTMADRRLC